MVDEQSWCISPGLDYITGFLGCLMAGVTAVPAYPPDPYRMERTFPRFQAIVNDSLPAAILSTSMILELAGDLFDEFPDFAGIARIATDALPADGGVTWRRPAITGSTVAFLQYTSGSTADPKGVMLTHNNLMANLELIRHVFAIHPGSTAVIWLPPYHDMGLIGGILEPLYFGMPCTLMSPLDFLQRPVRWLNALSRYGATISGGPNFAYDLVARKVTPATEGLARPEPLGSRLQRRRAGAQGDHRALFCSLRRVRLPQGSVLRLLRTGRGDAHCQRRHRSDAAGLYYRERG